RRTYPGRATGPARPGPLSGGEPSRAAAGQCLHDQGGDMAKATTNENHPRGLRGWCMREGRQLLAVLVLLAVARTSLANHYGVPSGSMEYTLMPGDHVVVDMSAYGLRVPFTDIIVVPRGEPGRGDIAVF